MRRSLLYPRVDGTKLADLMIDFEVGVTMRPVRVPKLDTDYFEEE